MFVMKTNKCNIFFFFLFNLSPATGLRPLGRGEVSTVDCFLMIVTFVTIGSKHVYVWQGF